LRFLRSMRVGISHWRGRISPLFDVASRLLLVDVNDGRESGREEVVLTRDDPLDRARELFLHEVDVLLCGAVSSAIAVAVTASGVRVIDQTFGPVDEVLAAFLADEFRDEASPAPSERPPRRRSRAGRERRRP
jgi:predicted Fe-Mo cluster-binding NifX family protein